MKSEIEIKFCDVDHDEIRAKLKKLGAKQIFPMRQMRRVTMDTPEMLAKGGWLRIRDEGDRTTMTYKQINDGTKIDGVKEVEVEVSNFDATVELMRAVLTPTKQSYQESKRELWKLGETEIVLDLWPWLDPMMEIEGADEKTVLEVAEKLKLDYSNGVFGDVMFAYAEQYNIDPTDEKDCISNLSEVRFADPLPDLFKK